MWKNIQQLDGTLNSDLALSLDKRLKLFFLFFQDAQNYKNNSQSLSHTTNGINSNLQ